MVVICEDCENDEAEHFCEDCEDGSQYYCADCAGQHMKKKRYAKHRMKAIEEESEANEVPFVEFVSELGFSECFSSAEKRFTSNDALVIHNTDRSNASCTFQPKELLPLILQKVMACNHHCRQIFLQKQTAHEPYPIIHHPMDTLLALILCCDDIFLQDLFKRLYTCQLAIPLLLPNPHTKEINFPLWAMREIVKQWKYCNASGEYVPCEGRLVDCEAPMVSFMRFNKAKDLHKSKILNGVISNSQHKYFFDHECDGSDAKRCYVDGLAEISWYLPNGKSDSYSTPVAFCNLRGDARNHPIQFKILTAISQVCFLFVRNEDINESLREMLSFRPRKSKVYLLMNVCSNMDMVSEIPNCSVLLLKNQGLAAIVKSIRIKINESCMTGQCITLSTCLNSKNSFDIIEMCDAHNVAGKKLADDVMKQIECQTDKSIGVKQALVPLQGKTLWQEWAKENKKQRRTNLQDIGDMTIQEYHVKQDKVKDAIMQKMMSIGYSDVMKIFVDALICQSPEQERVRSYFLHWLKLKLDDYSRKTLPELHKECESIRNLLKNLEESSEKGKNKEKEKLRERLRLKNQDLLNASFGLEHFFREFGVIYEMVSEKKSSPLWSDVKQFPKIAAELLLGGQPLELLDGDAAHIAINWITAVLEELKKLIGDISKLFVLSVLGIQSSGKSTLLNTAFGLRFAVSAGRCTRGAFFQLLKCDHTFQGICDYLLVIDTEGLRAPELAHEGTQKHDNELATLVIGLAGLTIINVFGEVSGEMDDILQTSVHAFLRMKEAELRPSCLLVKHHVDDVTANKGMDGLYKLQDKLDEMTIDAAHEEHCEGLYKKFSDVIQFNVEKDVYFFPNLWTGNPPMSPVEPKYSEAAQKLKIEVIRRMIADQTAERNVICTLAEFSLRVRELWKAVLGENFIFSFKNTLEIAAFNDLDQQSGKWSWDLENIVKNWEDKTHRALKAGKLESEEDVQKTIKEVEDELDVEHEKVKEEITTLFEKHKSASMLAQWRRGTERDFTKYTENHKKKASKFCHTIINNEKLAKKVKNEEGYREKIRKDVKKLVEKMDINKDSKITKEIENDLQCKFSVEWGKWMEEIENDAGPAPLQSGNIEDEILQQVLTHCGVEHLHGLIRKSVQSNPLSAREAAQTDHPLFMPVKRDEHIKAVDCRGAGKSKSKTSLQIQEIYHQINKRTASILESRKKYLDSVCETANDYQIREIQVIVRLIQQDVEELQKEVIDTFSFTAQYHVDIILTVCGYALRIFEKLRKKSHENHPITYFKSREEMYRSNFLSLCKEGLAEKATALQIVCDAAKNLSFLVMKSVESEFQTHLRNALKDKLYYRRSFFRISKALKKEVLLRLLQENSFSLYTTYLTNISQSYSYWMQRFVDQECSSLENGKSLIAIVADEELQSMKTSIVEYPVTKNYTYSSFEKWLETFRQRAGHLSIKKNDIEEFVSHYAVEEFDLFKSEFLKEFDSDMKNFAEEKVHSTFYWCKSEVANTFSRNTRGCTAQCPFCKEQCEYTTSNHGFHSCDMHRPQCLGGYHDSVTQEMTLSLCNDDVRGSGTFGCTETNWKWVPYKDYQTYFTNWRIDSYACSPCYWQWFIGEHSWNIAKHFGMKQPNKEWGTILNWRRWYSSSDAVRNVQEQYKNY